MTHEPELDSSLSDSTTVNETAEMPKARKTASGFGQFRAATEKNPLFGTSDDAPRVIEIAVASIEANPDQPRKHFDDERLRELADSIRDNGLIQPITVTATETPGRWRLVAGERRLRAHQILERETIYAIQNGGDPEVLALIENIQREQLDPLEEAEAYAQMIERHGYSQRELGRIVGKKQNTISEALSLSRLSPAVIEKYRTSDTPLSKNVLVEIAREADETRQLELVGEALSYKLGVRAIRERRKTPSPTNGTDKKPGKVVAANARKDRLIRSLHATVKRLDQDARVEDFPSGSDALARVRELKAQLDAQLDPILNQERMENAG